MKRIAILTVGLVAVAALLPETAQACAACLDASAENREAFILTTAFLTFLPLGMVSGVGLWLRHRAKERDVRDGLSPESSSAD